MNVLNIRKYSQNGAIAFAATSFGAGLMHSVFNMYYVKIFLDRYNVSEHWFHIVQSVYMVWNALNDPLIGYIQDNWDSILVRKRRYAILFGAPLFALSFLVPWFPWREYTEHDWLSGLHLMVTLCFYDTMFTFVLLAQGCILAEMTDDHESRLQMLQYSNCGKLFGSFSVFFCEVTSDHLSNYMGFQLTCCVLAIIAWLSMTYTGIHADTMYDTKLEGSVQKEGNGRNESHEGICTLTWQILTNTDFLCFVTMNFMNEFHSIFGVSFCIIITDAIVPRECLSPIYWSMFYGTVMVFPKVVSTVYRPVLSILGYYDCLRYLFIMKILIGVVMYWIGRQAFYCFIIFIIFDRTICVVALSMGTLVMADIIDGDKVVYKRGHPMSSMVLATNALITKPALSVAPMVAVSILNFYGYEEFKSHKLEHEDGLKDCMFSMVTLFSVIIGLIQYICWSHYNIRKGHVLPTKCVLN